MQEQSGNANNLWVFREGKSKIRTREMLKRLRDAVENVCAAPSPGEDALITSLLLAGELESALADSLPKCPPEAERLTTLLAQRLCAKSRLNGAADELARISELPLPESVHVSPPEGFAYYALHPLDIAALALRVLEFGGPVAIVGIRSIGTTLSAIVLGVARNQQRPAERITVRPTGHPYDRVTSLDRDQLLWINQQVAGGATFLV